MGLYDGVLGVAKLYMGPAAVQFVNRQLSTHLNTTAENLTPQHLDELAKWCFVCSKLVMDEAKAREFSEKVKALKI